MDEDGILFKARYSKNVLKALSHSSSMFLFKIEGFALF